MTSQALEYLGRAEEALKTTNVVNAALRAKGLALAAHLSEASDLVNQLLIDWHVESQAKDIGLNQLVSLLEAVVLVGHGEAADMLAEVLSPLPPLAGHTNTSSPTRIIGDAWALLRKPENARLSYDQGIDVCEQAGFRPELALTRAHLAELLLDHYPDERDAAIEHLDFAIAEFQDMKMQPALERALGRRGLLKA